ncbi:MAG: hypothetical protein H6604_07690 [Flavobacteriales bacterium]|nr:hypothetical protein [Flavobacteriales bacterium]
MKIIYTVLILSLGIQLYSQEFKINRDSLDLFDVSEKVELSDDLVENSGLQLVNSKIYTFNDSGGKAVVYVLDTLGNSLEEIHLKNAKNKDWEDIATDGKSIYIADTGNNYGNRKDLKVYFFDLDSIKNNSGKKEVEIREVRFKYKNQKEFPNSKHITDFDCEAIVFYNNQLHLFTKEWTSNETHHYTLDINDNKKQKLKPIESFDVDMLVTGAEIIDDILYLVGYEKKGIVNLYQFQKSKDSDLFFESKYKKTYLGFSPAIGQIEGITGNSENLYISGEHIKVGFIETPQIMYRLKL